MKKLFLIDGNSYLYRAFYAIRELSTSSGFPTNAVYGFIAMLNKLIEREKPEYLAICFDRKEPTFRHQKFADYKIHRKPMPGELIEQIPLIKEIVSAYRIRRYELPGYEADDLIATISKKLAERELTIFIVTGDKDILQLVDERIKVYHTHKEGLIYDRRKVKERFGVGPERIPDILALAGDASDNIPGVRGIGEKGARALIEKFGTLENLFSHLDEVRSPHQQKLLRTSEKEARLSKELATVDTRVPLKVNLKELRHLAPDKEKLIPLLEKLEFHSLLKKLSSAEEKASPPRASKPPTLTSKELEALPRDLKRSEKFSFAITAEPKGATFFSGKKSFWVSFKKGLPRAQLQAIFTDKKTLKIAYDIKKEIIILRRLGIKIAAPLFDPMIAAYLLHPEAPPASLTEIARKYPGSRSAASTPAEETEISFHLLPKLSRALGEMGLDELFEKIEMPLSEVLASMELAGVKIDTKKLSRLAAEISGKLTGLKKKIIELAGVEFNINSPKQLSAILFEKLKLPVIRRSQTGASTDASTLKALIPFHPLPARLLEYREMMKLKTGYIDNLPPLINPQTGRVHTSFNQTATATGRLSSSEPNLQNIPTGGSWGGRLREVFTPAKGSLFISFDYSQIELRILAHLSRDKNLVEAFERDEDIHRCTASLIFGVGEEEVTDEMRATAKTVNFGIVYGISPFGLSRQLRIEQKKAKSFIDSYFERYPGVKLYLDEEIEKARTGGSVTTLFGRRRNIPELRSKNIALRQFGARVAINTPIQGGAADLIKMAMIEIYRALAEEGLKSKMIIQVHDELLFEVPQEEKERLLPLVREKMEGVTKLSVRLKVDIKIGKNWAHS